MTTVTCRSAAYRVNLGKIRRIADTVCERLGVGDHDVSVTLAGSRTIRRLNREFRGIDKATDVLSFPQIAFKKPLVPGGRARRTTPVDTVLGDVVISLPEAAANAKRIGQPLDREVCFLLVHGILHLCGHDHMKPTEEKRMLAAQRSLMRVLATQKAWQRSVRAP